MAHDSHVRSACAFSGSLCCDVTHQIVGGCDPAMNELQSEALDILTQFGPTWNCMDDGGDDDDER
eukprot:9498929-Pyramimonas_sp.AAC.1